MKVVVGGEVIVQMICARLIQYCGTETIPINTAALRLLPLSEVPASPATRIERVLFVILLAFVLIGIELLTVLTHLLFLIVIFLFLAVRAIVNEQCLRGASTTITSPPTTAATATATAAMVCAQRLPLCSTCHHQSFEP